MGVRADMGNEQIGLTRRDLIRKGVLLGGTTLWVTPVVHAVGMTPALAQAASPGCNTWYAVKIERIDDNGGWACFDISGQTDPNSPGQCLDVDDVGNPVVTGGCGHLAKVNVPDEGASDPTWTVQLDEGCQFTGVCYVKLGQGNGVSCVAGCSWDPATQTISFSSTTGADISHVEFSFCCEE